MRADLEHLHQWPRQVWHVWSLRPASQCDPVLSLHGLCLHFSLPVFLHPSMSIPRLQKPLSQPIWAAGWSGRESRSRVSRLVWKYYSLEIFKGGTWRQLGGFSPTFPQVPSWNRSWSRLHTHQPPFTGVCRHVPVCLVDGPSLQGRHTAVIESGGRMKQS